MVIDRYKAIFCDLDGCLVSGDVVLPGARELAAAAARRLYIVSNNSTDTPRSLAARLGASGIAVAPERILLAGVAAVEHVARRWPGAAVALYGARALRRYAGSLGLRLDAEPTEVALLTRDPGFTYGSLADLLARLHGGARLVVSNLDATHPGPGGVPVPETGALLEAVRACRPDLAFEVVGKPEPWLFAAALARAAVAPGDALFVGDNPATDGEGARRAGLAFHHVRPGAGLLPLVQPWEGDL